MRLCFRSFRDVQIISVYFNSERLTLCINKESVFAIEIAGELNYAITAMFITFSANICLIDRYICFAQMFCTENIHPSVSVACKIVLLIRDM